MHLDLLPIKDAKIAVRSPTLASYSQRFFICHVNLVRFLFVNFIKPYALPSGFYGRILLFHFIVMGIIITISRRWGALAYRLYMLPNVLPVPAQISFMSSVFIRVEIALLQKCCNQLNLRLKTDVIVF